MAELGFELVSFFLCFLPFRDVFCRGKYRTVLGFGIQQRMPNMAVKGRSVLSDPPGLHVACPLLRPKAFNGVSDLFKFRIVQVQHPGILSLQLFRRIAQHSGRGLVMPKYLVIIPDEADAKGRCLKYASQPGLALL